MGFIKYKKAIHIFIYTNKRKHKKNNLILFERIIVSHIFGDYFVTEI